MEENIVNSANEDMGTELVCRDEEKGFKAILGKTKGVFERIGKRNLVV